MVSPSEWSHRAPPQVNVQPVTLFETLTSGGVANAIAVAPYRISSSPCYGGNNGVEWLALTDAEQGYVFIIEWSAKRGTFEEISGVKLSLNESGNPVTASIAVWLA